MPEKEATTLINHFDARNQSVKISATTFLTANSTDTNQSSKKQRTQKKEHNFRVDNHQERWKVLNNNNPDRIRIIIDAVNHYNTESRRIQKLGGVIKKTDEYPFAA